MQGADACAPNYRTIPCYAQCSCCQRTHPTCISLRYPPHLPLKGRGSTSQQVSIAQALAVSLSQPFPRGLLSCRLHMIACCTLIYCSLISSWQASESHQVQKQNRSGKPAVGYMYE